MIYKEYLLLKGLWMLGGRAYNLVSHKGIYHALELLRMRP